MSNGRTLAPHRPELVTDGLAPRRPRWLEMTMSSDHKDVGRLYIVGALSFLVLGMIAFLLMRLQLAVPENDLIEPVTFNRLLSVGSATLIVLFALPFVFGLFTYVVPLQIGARSLAFPRLGQLAVWLFLLGGGLLYVSFVYTPPEAGFNAWPTLSDTIFISNNGVDVWIAAVGLTVLGLVLQSINLAVTVAKLRAPGLAWRRLPTFSFSAAVSSWTMIIAGAAMVAALTMLEIDRHFDGVFFDPGEGGAPLYYQHLSWIFFPGTYLCFLLPSIGAISEILPVFSGKPLLSRRAMTFSIAAIMPLGLLAWMQNMMSASIPIGFLYAAMLMSLLLAIPIGVVFVNWLGTIAGGVLRMRAPLVFALAAISTLSFGLILELIQSVIPVNWLLADTTASTAASGYVLVGGPVLAGFAALSYWFPKMTGRVMGEGLARSSAALIVIGAHVTFLPLLFAGIDGQQVDIFKFFEASDAINATSLNAYNLIATIGAFVLCLGVVLTLVNAYSSLKGGVATGPDPWGGETLEWFATSPPPPHNFDVVPDVRSDEPLRDIREAIRRRDPDRNGSSATPAESQEPVA